MARPSVSVKRTEQVATIRRITCIACGLAGIGATDILCTHCAVDTPALRAHLMATKLGYQTQLTRAWDTLEAAIPDDLNSPLYQRWCAYQQAIADNTDADRMAVASIEVLARRGRADPLLDLIRLWLAYTDAKAVYQEREQWAEQVYQAIGELEDPIRRAAREWETAWGDTPRLHEYPMPQAKQTACRSCKALVVWTTTNTGANVPLSVASILERDGIKYAVSHFVDCPQAKGWSK